MLLGGAVVGGNSSGRVFSTVRLHGLLGRNRIRSGESIFYSFIQRLFTAIALGLIADCRF